MHIFKPRHQMLGNGLRAASLIVLMAALPVRADDVTDELEFAGALIEMGFTDFAERVTRRW